VAKESFKKFCFFCFRKTNDIINVEINDRFSINDSTVVRKKRQGYKNFMWERVHGWFSSGDPKIKKGVIKKRTIDKEKNEYHEKVKDNKTGKILRECDEKLTDHR